VLRTASSFLPGTLDYVQITDGDDATISWYNSKDLPDAVSAAAPDIVSRVLKGIRGAPINGTTDAFSSDAFSSDAFSSDAFSSDAFSIIIIMLPIKP
jgi:hypothetical protein